MKTEIQRQIKEQLALRDSMTQEEWFDYCALKLKEIMNENKDVYVRLKNR